MTTAVPERRERQARRIRGLLLGWAAVAALFLLWQTLTYRGLMALAAEWQFNTFGRYYPSLTYILMAALIGSPALWLLRRRRSDAPAATGTALPGVLFIRGMLGVGIGCLATCLIVLIAMAGLPSDAGMVQRITLGPRAAAMVPGTGPTVLTGVVVRERTAGLNQDLLVARRTIRFAPMLAPDATDRSVRFFVEIGPNEDAATLRADGAREGILRRSGLPGELEKLFSYAGYDATTPYYTLFASRDGLQWPYKVAATQLALLALACLIAAGLLHLRRERLRRRLLADRVNAA